jgi:large subunit ribosomal protein L4
LNRKVKDLAKISALSYKAKNNEIIVVEEISMATPKTKQLVEVMGNLKVSDKKALIVLPEYDIMNADVLVITENTAKIFAEDQAEVVA